MALTGCNNASSAQRGASQHPSGSGVPDDGILRLGQASPPQNSTMKASADARFTVTPTKVRTGTRAEMQRSGLKEEDGSSPQVPVFVWSTLTHKSGTPMSLNDMNDLVVRTNQDQRTRPLIVVMGEAQWRDCPDTDYNKKLHAGQSEKICTAYLIPEGQTAVAVELSRGFYQMPLQWPVSF
ncbi:hypothetical protein AB0A98_41190 [Streptomyces chrestomyceticus]|uniref:hypothetical protein n=1 Tax=Streptomyces chrestomyceticus TaxID=68185 RepID=UPI0033FDDFB6